MKKIISAAGIAFIAACVFFASCDKIDDPVKENNSTPTDTDSTVVIRKILVEDYTGHNCGNCPHAKEVLDSIEMTYSGHIVSMGVHAGFFANPPISGCTAIDFRTAAGTAFDNFFGISNAGNPNGMINRMEFPSLNHIKAPDDWKGIVNGIISLPADVKMTITNSYTSATRTVSINITNEFLNSLTGDYKVGVYVTEDSVVACQEDYSQVPSLITNYVNRNMLRGDVNTTWGEALVTDPAAGSAYPKSYSYTLNAAWNDAHCHIVAFIYNAVTYEVIQSEEAKVIQ